jgi:chaperonin GroEL
VRVVRSALAEPLRWIAANAGLEGGVVTARVAELPVGQGLDAETREFVDLVPAGIVDPVKVTKAALENANSIASLVLSTDGAVVDKPEKAETNGHSHPHVH